MSKEELIKERNELFNEDFSIKLKDLDRIISFCKYLTEKTGVQACNAFGYINELLPKLYTSCLDI